MKRNFANEGWTSDSLNVELIRKVYLKLTCDLQRQWLNAIPTVEDHLIKKCTLQTFHSEKVNAFVAYKDKLFSSLANGSIERRIRNNASAPPAAACNLQLLTFEEVYRLRSGAIPNLQMDGNEGVHDDHVLGR